MKKKALKWTKEELEILKNNYCELGLYKTTTLIPNHPMCSVVAKARKLGLRSEKMVKWTEEELEILRKYYPVEGAKVCKRLKNRSKENVKSTAQRYNISFYQTTVEWPAEVDSLTLEFYLEHGPKSIYKVEELLKILRAKGFTKHGYNTVRMKLQNFSYLDIGKGYSHASKRTKELFNKRNKITM